MHYREQHHRGTALVSCDKAAPALVRAELWYGLACSMLLGGDWLALGAAYAWDCSSAPFSCIADGV